MATTDRRIATEHVGMTQEEALVSLQREASANNELITSFVRQGNRWVATLRHVSEFPPSADDSDDEGDSKPAGEEDGSGESAPAEKPEGDSEGGDSPFPPKGDGEKKDSEGGPKPPHGEHGDKPGGSGVEHELLALLTQIADKLGVQPAGAEPKMAPGVGPDVPPPPGPPKPPAGPAGPGGPAGGPPPGAGPKGQPYGTKLKPGEVPNRPGVVPVGAPSFASTRKQADSPFSWSPQPATPTPGSDVAPNVNEAGNPGVVSSPPCSKCGGPTEGGICAQCTQGAGGMAGGYGQQPGQPVMANTAEVFYIESGVQMNPVEAHRELTDAYGPQGYKVASLTPKDDGTVHAKLVRV